MPMILLVVTGLMFAYFTVLAVGALRARESERRFMHEQGMPPPSVWSMTHYPVMAVLMGALLAAEFLPPWPYQPLIWVLIGGLLLLQRLFFLSLFALHFEAVRHDMAVLPGVLLSAAGWLFMVGYALLVGSLGVTVLYVLSRADI